MKRFLDTITLTDVSLAHCIMDSLKQQHPEFEIIYKEVADKTGHVTSVVIDIYHIDI